MYCPSFVKLDLSWKITVENFIERSARLYEREPRGGVSSPRLGLYVNRWCRMGAMWGLVVAYEFVLRGMLCGLVIHFGGLIKWTFHYGSRVDRLLVKSGKNAPSALCE